VLILAYPLLMVDINSLSYFSRRVVFLDNALNLISDVGPFRVQCGVPIMHNT
jgi:hypothetical protein